MSRRQLSIVQLYPRNMNIYGDWGNTLVLKRRLEWRGFSVELIEQHVGDALPAAPDIVVGGGGQDSGQGVIHQDLLRIGPRLHELAHDGVPMLMICGLYQLFGNVFRTRRGRVIEGIGLLDIETYAGEDRLVGDVVAHSDQFGDIVGYENHSGQTYLGEQVVPLGTVTEGAGNNGRDHTEGARYRCVIGTYLHGSLLPKNPMIADFLIERAVTRRFGEYTPTPLDDRFADRARQLTLNRSR